MIQKDAWKFFLKSIDFLWQLQYQSVSSNLVTYTKKLVRLYIFSFTWNLFWNISYIVTLINVLMWLAILVQECEFAFTIFLGNLRWSKVRVENNNEDGFYPTEQPYMRLVPHFLSYTFRTYLNPKFQGMVMLWYRTTIIYTSGADVMMSRAVATKCGDLVVMITLGNWFRLLETNHQGATDTQWHDGKTKLWFLLVRFLDNKPNSILTF